MRLKGNSGKETGANYPIIFFDGVCGLCNSFVNIIFNNDKNKVFRYSPLQGETAKALLPELPENPGEWSIVYVDEYGIYAESGATLRILRRMGGAWGLLSYLSIIPVSLRDFVYRMVAKYRYRIFGKYESCRVPTEKEKEQFLP